MAKGQMKLPTPKLVLLAMMAGLIATNFNAGMSLLKGPKSVDRTASFASGSIVDQRANVDSTALDQKPLFTSTRTASIADAPTRVSSTAPLKLTPKGTSIYRNQRSVVMSSSKGPVVIREGETRHGVKIIKVSPDKVILESDGRRREIAFAKF